MDKEPQDLTSQGVDKNEDNPAESQQGQSMIKDKVREGFIFTEDEDLKRFYLKLAFTMCPSLTPESTEIEALFTLYTRIKKSRRLLALMDSYPWSDNSPLFIKACCFMFMDNTNTSLKEKRLLNSILFDRASFICKIMELHDLISRDLIFFSQIKTNLEAMLHIQTSEQENQDNESTGKDKKENSNYNEKQLASTTDMTL